MRENIFIGKNQRRVVDLTMSGQKTSVFDSGKICKEMKENVVVVSSGEGRDCVPGGPAQT